MLYTITRRRHRDGSQDHHRVQQHARRTGPGGHAAVLRQRQRMAGFSGMTVQQEQALADAVQNGTVGSEADLETWLANNHIIAATSRSTAENSRRSQADAYTAADMLRLDPACEQHRQPCKRTEGYGWLTEPRRAEAAISLLWTGRTRSLHRRSLLLLKVDGRR